MTNGNTESNMGELGGGGGGGGGDVKLTRYIKNGIGKQMHRAHTKNASGVPNASTKSTLNSHEQTV